MIHEIMDIKDLLNELMTSISINVKNSMNKPLQTEKTIAPS